jgi:phosphopantothenoylcysteine decarboxylase / phosphopantothenate---cysteine ligase
MLTKKILLIISGGIAAYKSLELIRLLKKNGFDVSAILTHGGAQFITPLSVSALTGQATYQDLWSLKDETEMGHIRLVREADLIVVAPATAHFMAKMAHGLGDDLASTCLLVAKPEQVAIAPAMNPSMWDHPATQANWNILQERGYKFIGPEIGDMACGENGLGRMSEPNHIATYITDFFSSERKILSGKKFLVTAGRTIEMLDPVRVLSNLSSGKQGFAIADALQRQGAEVTLIAGETDINTPHCTHFLKIKSARDMAETAQKQIENTLFDGAICAAAVSDWALPHQAEQKIKKDKNQTYLNITLEKTPDTLALIANHKNRPALVIGFAAETENLVQYAKEKLVSKKCDWILANQVAQKENPVFGSDVNQVTWITSQNCEEWPSMSKTKIAERLVEKIYAFYQKGHDHDCSQKFHHA